MRDKNILVDLTDSWSKIKHSNASPIAQLDALCDSLFRLATPTTSELAFKVDRIVGQRNCDINPWRSDENLFLASKYMR